MFDKIKYTTDPIKDKILHARIKQIVRLNNVEKQYRPFFYVAFYDVNEKNLLENVESACQYLHHCEIDGYSIISASVKTKEIVKDLPKLDF
ncbi:MAG: hypothetical protein LBF68_08220 [Christensenellaceae bacterium]|nr:hypothetical protein [Christensenellaceae bacterium]